MNLIPLNKIVMIAGESINPSAHKSETFAYFSLPAFDSGEFNKTTGEQIKSNKTLVCAGDVLISKLNPRIPRVWSVPETPGLRAICSTEFIPLRRLDMNLNPDFLRWMCLAPQFIQPIQREAISSTKSHQRVRPGLFLQQSIPFLTLAEQRRIVARIQECMERVRESHRLHEECHAQAAAVFPATVEDILKSQKGKKTCLAEVCNIVGNLVDPRGSPYRNMLHVGGANIVAESGELIALQTAEAEGLISGKFAFTAKDVLYSKIRPYLKKVARPDFAGLCSADMYPLRPREDRISRDFLFYLLMSRDFTSYAIRVSNRAGMPKVNREQLFAYEFHLPDLDAQAKMVEKLEVAYHATLGLRSEMSEVWQRLEKLQSSILRQAFAGEL